MNLTWNKKKVLNMENVEEIWSYNKSTKNNEWPVRRPIWSLGIPRAMISLRDRQLQLATSACPFQAGLPVDFVWQLLICDLLKVD